METVVTIPIPERETFQRILTEWTNSSWSGIIQNELLLSTPGKENFTTVIQRIPFINGTKQAPTLYQEKSLSREFYGKNMISLVETTYPVNQPTKLLDSYKEAIFRLVYVVETKVGERNWRLEFAIEATFSSADKHKFTGVINKLMKDNPKNVDEFMVKALHGKTIIYGRTESQTIATEGAMELIQKVISIAGERDPKFDRVMLEICKHLSRKFTTSIKRLGKSVVGLSKYIYQNEVLNSKLDWYVCEKADGVRHFLYVSSDGIVYLVGQTLAEIGRVKSKGPLLLDVEYIDSGLIRVFDILVDGVPIIKEPFHKRYQRFQKAVGKLHDAGINVIAGEFHKLPANEADRKALLDSIWHKEHPYEKDGLIFTEDAPYYEMKVYKWKPPEQLTIDFVIRSVPKSLIGSPPMIPKSGFNMYILFCGVSNDLFTKLRMRRINGYGQLFPQTRPDYFPIQFSTKYVYYQQVTDQHAPDLDKQVGEFRLNKDGEWELVRMRADKLKDYMDGLYYGNDYVTAEHTYGLAMNPLTFDELATGTSMYFAKPKEEKHRPATYFSSFVKSQLLNEIRYNPFKPPSSQSVLDLASGKGQDLFRYFRMWLGRLTAMDIDPSAIEELNRRVLEIKEGRTAVRSLVVDLNQPYADTLKALEEPGGAVEKYDFIVCNLAIHYLVETNTGLENIFNLINSVLIPGGKFLFTCLDGETVFNRMKDRQFMDFVDSENDVKYTIEKKYSSNKFEKFGQRIAVRLPFTGDQLYEENLVNVENLLNFFERRGYEREKYHSFAQYFERFERANPEVSSKMSNADRDFVSLYCYASLWKGK